MLLLERLWKSIDQNNSYLNNDYIILNYQKCLPKTAGPFLIAQYNKHI